MGTHCNGDVFRDFPKIIVHEVWVGHFFMTPVTNCGLDLGRKDT